MRRWWLANAELWLILRNCLGFVPNSTRRIITFRQLLRVRVADAARLDLCVDTDTIVIRR